MGFQPPSGGGSTDLTSVLASIASLETRVTTTETFGPRLDSAEDAIAPISATAVVIHAKTSNFTVMAGDVGGMFIANSAGAIVCTIPDNTGGTIAASGEEFQLLRGGTGTVAVAGSGTGSFSSVTGITTFTGGAKLVQPFGYLSLSEIGSPVSIIRDNADANLWYLIGDLE